MKEIWLRYNSIRGSVPKIAHLVVRGLYLHQFLSYKLQPHIELNLESLATIFLIDKLVISLIFFEISTFVRKVICVILGIHVPKIARHYS